MENKGQQESSSSVERYTEENHPGRDICDCLRNIRKKVAEQNNIELKPAECHNTMPCRGTCPICDAEVEYLEEKLSEMMWMRKHINLEGLMCGEYDVSNIWLLRVIARSRIMHRVGGIRRIAEGCERNLPEQHEDS